MVAPIQKFHQKCPSFQGLFVLSDTVSPLLVTSREKTPQQHTTKFGQFAQLLLMSPLAH